MKYQLILLFSLVFFIGCSKETSPIFSSLPKTHLLESSFEELPHWDEDNFKNVLHTFTHNCKSKKTRKMYQELCEEAEHTLKEKEFIEKNFTPYKIYTKENTQKGLLTGYYEPQLKASLSKSEVYKYPIYETPKDLIIVNLSSIYPDLKNYRLRGKLEGNTLVPYHTRKESSSKHIPANVICYTDSKIDLFFLEIQGSGRVRLDTGELLYLGYDNQNGHKYRAIGRYLVEIGALKIEEVSLQSIRAWLDENPLRVDEVLNYNDSLVYFKQRNQAASGSLGLELTPKRSIAVDRRYIPLGSMLYMNTAIAENNVSRVVFAQDTGGAIKGSIRADLFMGSGEEAREIAGKLKSPLELWILLRKKNIDE